MHRFSIVNVANGSGDRDWNAAYLVGTNVPVFL